MFNPIQKSRIALLVLALLVYVGPAAGAPEVNLEYSPVSQTVLQGDVFEVRLIARSVTGLDVAMAGISAVVKWDPTKLELQGRTNDGPYTWLRSDFGPVGDLDNLNEDVNPADGVPDNDGDAFYQAESQLAGDPAFATTGGLHVVTFLFQAVDGTDQPTPLEMPLTMGLFSETKVVSGTVPGLNILNIVVEATVTVLPDCDANGVPDECDLDCGVPSGPCDVPGCGTSPDCNLSGIPDVCEIPPLCPACADCNTNGLPDACEVPPLCPECGDCNDNGVPDDCEPPDCNCNGIPDECDIACGPPAGPCDVPGCGLSLDGNNNGVPDECACGFAYGDVDRNGVINIFDLLCVLAGFAGDFNVCPFEDDDLAPCGGNGLINIFDLLAVLGGFAGIDPCCGG